MSKNPNDELARLEARKKEIQSKIRKIKRTQTEKERKARAHRLIQVGAAVETVLGRPIEGERDLANLTRFLEQQQARGNWFSLAMNTQNHDHA